MRITFGKFKLTASHILTLLTAVILTCTLTSATNVSNSVLDGLRSELAKADGAADSLRISLDLFDLAPREEAKKLGWQIYDLSLRAKDEQTTHFILRQLSCFYLKQDTVIDRIERLVEKLPESNEKEVSKLFVSIQNATGKVTYSLSTDQRVAELKKRLAAQEKKNLHNDNDESDFDKIRDLWELCLYIGNTTKGEGYVDNLTRLEDMIGKVNDKFRVLKNAYYTTAAIAYTEAGYPEKAIQADRHLLEVIRNLEKMYAEMGREYRSYDRYYYICYRRILSNYHALPLADVDIYYKKIKELAAKDKEVSDDLNSSARPTIYWHMAHKRYADVIPLLKKSIERESNKRVKLDLYELLKTAATNTGDRESLLYALEPLNDLLEDYIQSSAAIATQEYQIRFDVDDMKARNARMELEQKDAKISYSRRVIMVSLIAGFLLIVIAMLIFRFYTREKATVRRLAERNSQLEMELHDVLHSQQDDNAWQEHRKKMKAIKGKAPKCD